MVDVLVWFIQSFSQLHDIEIVVGVDNFIHLVFLPVFISRCVNCDSAKESILKDVSFE